jgi:hypothetical protein
VSHRRRDRHGRGSARRARGSPVGQGGARGRRRLALLAVGTACALLVALAAFLAFSAGSGEAPGPPKAAIVDQLSLTFPNQDFVDKATGILEGAGYAVDYYPGEAATVEFYRDVPQQDYKLLVLRVHSALLKHLTPRPGVSSAVVERAIAALEDNVFLFTSDAYSDTQYLEEQTELRLVPVDYVEHPPPYTGFFGIASDFVRSSMRGKFDGTTVILMGCDGLTFDTTAAAFIEKGAKAVIGWHGAVSAAHTDEATERLLHYLMVEDLTPSEAAARAMADVGPDPSYGSKLQIYPAEKAASGAP